MKKYWLALWWGWARWFVHIWILKHLEKNNIEISEIAWTSMWAIIWAMTSIWKSPQEIIEFAKSINFLKMGDPDFRTWLLKWKKVEKLLRKIFGNLKIEQTKIPLKIVATNLETSKSRIFDRGDLVDAIRASISLPWIFIPKKIEDELYVDGWIMMNLPIECLNAENIIAISALKINQGPVVKKKSILWISFKTGFFRNNYEIIKRSVILMMKVNEENSLKTKGKNIKFIRPNFGTLDILDFNKLEKFVELGYEEGRGVLDFHKNIF